MSMNNKTNCPNCGAAFQHLYNHRCPYCRTMLDFRVEEVDEIDPRYLRNVKLVGIERTLERSGFFLKFEGTYIRYAQALEYTKNNTSICIDANYSSPKRVYYCLYIPKQEFINLIQYGNFDALADSFPFEIDKKCFIDAIMKYREV